MAASKRAIPQQTRREVALRALATPGERTVARCVYCGHRGRIYWPRLSNGKPGAWVAFTDLELDHLVPEHLGGAATAENVVLACRRCNRSKGHRTLAEWRAATNG